MYTKKIIAVLLIFILTFNLTACGINDNFSSENYHNNESLTNDISQDFPDNNDFSNFADNLFKESVTNDTLTLHTFLEHPENYGIDDYNITLGTYDYDLSIETKELSDAYTALKAFDRNTLSHKQQITYDELMITIENELQYCDLYLLRSDLCTTTGIHLQLPLVMAEYTFEEEKDVVEYLNLLKDFPNYFTSLVNYENLRSEKGYFMTKDLAETIINECDDFSKTAANGFLVSTFDERIDSLSGIPTYKLQQYKEMNRQYLSDYVVKAYNILSDGLKKIKSTGKYNGGLCNYPSGDKYFEYIIESYLGWGKSIDDYNKLLDDYILSELTTMQTLMKQNPSLYDKFYNFSFQETKPENIINDLKAQIKESYPELTNIDCQIKYISKDLEEKVSPAMYFIPQIDNYSNNTIYINLSDNNTNELYPTLAHEGYPGHMFQTIYFNNTDHDLIRNLISPGGYVEGWATYCELNSYNYAKTDNKKLNDLLRSNHALILCLYAKCDIGINYFGWTNEDVYNYISAYGFTEKKISDTMFKDMCSNPGNYCQYVLGWIAIEELKKEARQKSGNNFSELNFHKYLLDMGPVPFKILFDNLDNNIS